MKKKFVIGLLIALGFLVGESVFSVSFNQEVIDFARKLNAFPAEQTNAYPSKKQVVERFCKTALSESLQDGFSQLYRSQDSIFVKILCKETKKLTDDHLFSPFLQEPSENPDSYLAPNYAKAIKFPRECQTDQLDKCRLDRLSHLLMTEILDEFFILKKARIHGIISENFTSDEILEKEIHDLVQHWIFAPEYHNGEITDNFCRGQNHRYPQTCRLMKNSIRQFKSAFSSFKILNLKNFFEDSFRKVKSYKKEKDNYCYADPEQPETYDFLFCQLMFSEPQDFSRFISLVYNELLWQTLFTTYSAQQLGLNSHLTEEQLQEIQGLLATQALFMNISNQALESLSEFQGVYPLHIGVLVYQEDLLWLRNKYLSKLVNPFYSLFYKLQNVQIPSSN